MNHPRIRGDVFFTRADMRPIHLPHLPVILPPVVGLLGGSFNPAHEGHVHISRVASRILGTKMIWWVVSPQNPLKPTEGMADYDTRLEFAKQRAAGSRFITVTDIERQLGTQVTIASLRALKKRYPRTRFVWLMGADNLSSIHHWERWNEIFTTCPILVLDRAPMSHRALRSPAAIRFHKARLPMKQLQSLPGKPLPAWGFAHMRKHPESATHLRKTLGENAFLVHNKPK